MFPFTTYAVIAFHYNKDYNYGGLGDRSNEAVIAFHYNKDYN